MSRLRKVTGFLGSQSASAIVTTATLSVAFLIFNDYIAPPPDLAGRWKFTITYEDTNQSSFKDMQVTYQALLIQEGLTLNGTGEKVSDKVATADEVKEYSDSARVHIDLEGTVRRKYFSPDELVIHYKEDGKLRPSSTLHDLKHFDHETMCGCFASTIADTTGTVWWARVEKDVMVTNPVERPKNCSEVVCVGSGFE
jgi:hypothetical protein